MKITCPMLAVMSVVCLIMGGLSLQAGAPSGSNAAPATASATNSTGSHAAPALTNAVPDNRILIIAPSSMPVAAGKATLTIGPLQRTNGVYAGSYQIKVFPYFFQNETGRLAIRVPDDSLAGIDQGKVTAIIGNATTSGKGGRSRHIDATVSPVDSHGGMLKLWFLAGKRKMVFEPAYHFEGPGTIAKTD